MAGEPPPSGLEQAANAAHANATPNANAAGEAVHGKPAEQKKPKTTLESVVNETNDLFKKSFDVSLGLGAAAATTAFLGMQNGASSLSSVVDKGRDGIVVPLSYAAGEKYVQKGNFSTKHFRDEMISGAIQTAGIIYPAYKYMNLAQQGIVNAVSATSYANYATAAGIVGRSIMNVPLYFPPAILGYYIVDHLVKKRTFKGLYSETIKPNFKSDLKNAYKYLGIPVLLNALLMPAALQVPGAALLTFAYKLLMSGKQKKEAKQKDEGPGYISSGFTGAHKLVRNTTKGIYDTVYAIGSSISDLYKSSPKAAAPAHPAPAGAAPH
ncbi:MAG: hypothetical protein AABX32_02535 [Nanoarchaeota archaeon]